MPLGVALNGTVENPLLALVLVGFFLALVFRGLVLASWFLGICALAPGGPAMATRQGACGFEVESLARMKNACDTVVAAFFEVHHHRYRDAFHPKARSPFLIALTCTWITVVYVWMPFAHRLTAVRYLNTEWLNGQKSGLWKTYTAEVNSEIRLRNQFLRVGTFKGNMNHQVVITSLLAGLVILDVLAVRAIVKSGWFTRSQIVAQTFLVCLIPVFGAVIAFVFLRSQRPMKRQTEGADPHNWDNIGAGRNSDDVGP